MTRHIVALLLLLAPLPVFAQHVHIPDPNLRAAVRDALNLPADAPVTRETMLPLYTLKTKHNTITDLTGLQHAVNLKSLVLSVNYIHDISPLATLTKLEFVILRDNPIHDLSPLSNLMQLTYLNVAGTPIQDLTPLASLTRLQELNAQHCRITDIAPLANLIALEKLSLQWNQIIDITPLANLIALEKLSLQRNQIIDITPLADLTRLKELQIHNNHIVDFSPLSGLSLIILNRDEECVFPGLSVQHRIQTRNMPSVVLWFDDGILNRGGNWWNPSIPILERAAAHDLWSRGDHFRLNSLFTPKSDGWYQSTLVGNIHEAITQREELLSLNPNMLFIVDLRQKYMPIDRYPEDWRGWVRDDNGNRVFVFEKHAFINFKLPEVQDAIVQRAVSVARCGLYDGISFDAWGGDDYSILRTIRENVPDDFLILFNTNHWYIPDLAPYINGTFMETFPIVRENGYTREHIIEIETNLIWWETNAREPQINCLRGFGIGDEPPDSPNNRRWMRLFTTMSLTCSDGYALYTLGTIDGQKQYQKHIWHPFWDADLGQPISSTAQLYQRVEGLYIREFTNGWALYNRSGEAQAITLPEQVQGVASGWINTEHALPDLDGEMYLRVNPKNPADINRDGIVNILDLTLVAQGFGTGDLTADVNGDGVVNVFDLVFVANAF